MASAMPRLPLFALIGLVATTLVIVSVVRVTGIGAVEAPLAAAVDRVDLRFADRADGGIDIVDAATGRTLADVEPGTHGFLRGTMRGLARERRRQGIGADPPFSLVGRADGRLTLEDPATGRRIDLGSFGPVNAAVFVRLLPSRPTASPAGHSPLQSPALQRVSATVATHPSGVPR